ncbi:MAG TPA: hypothetical protein VGR89_00135 [Puia sp.]|nr:hypothetical protein [Puia sp.]
MLRQVLLVAALAFGIARHSFGAGGPNERGVSGGPNEGGSSKRGKVALPQSLRHFIRSIRFDALGDLQPRVSVSPVEENVTKVTLVYNLPRDIRQDDWRVRIVPAFHASFHWAPLLTPMPDNVIAQHVFRSPALIVSGSGREVSVVPDLDWVGRPSEVPWYMDMDAPANTLTLGWSLTKVSGHTLYVRKKGLVITPGKMEFGFYLITGMTAGEVSPWRSTEHFLWHKWGKPLYDSGEPLSSDLDNYVDRTYHWAFDSWRNAVWQEFRLNGREVGAPVFIVNVTQSPDYPGPANEREFRSIWNQAWFSSLRSAAGLYRYARRTHNDSLLRKALLTKELALSFPQQDGLFPAVIGTEMTRKDTAGKTVNISAGWGHYFFGNSNRNPQSPGGPAQSAPYHILDMSWTADQMLTWYIELEKDQRLLAYAERFAKRLVQLQDSAGYFPAWIDMKTGQLLPQLRQSPETSASAGFLLSLYSITQDERWRSAGLKALGAVVRDVLPSGRWEDFETYWSCSRIYADSLGRKLHRNDQYKQNTLSMYWTADACLRAYLQTRDSSWLSGGRRALDELLMYQATWQPPFIYVHALGGFGVMNADAEWNDARQSLFAELIIQYGRLLNEQEYVERGIAALKASFVMMYSPENPETETQWQKVYPFFMAKDYGFMMENYGHGGVTSPDGLGIGEFTIYDWGNGAAAEAYNRILDHYSDVLRTAPKPFSTARY